MIMDVRKVVILAGGLGSRLSEETEVRPKPMVEIGGRPIIWHIMKIYSKFGLNDFIVCLGYKGYVIKEFFSNYHLHTADVTFDLANNNVTIHQKRAEQWRVTLVETGDTTMTGGRISRIRAYVGDESFFLTYGDGVADIEIPKLLAVHQSRGAYATLTVVQPPGRFGAIDLGMNDMVRQFQEKPHGDGNWINGGFMVFAPKIFDYIASDATVLEQEPLQQLAAEGKLAAYQHKGFWQAMDTLRDKRQLEQLWHRGSAPWKVW
jgi:glucose-1-phosphate cytidylyltransferase